jgi:hypothetical protein
MKHTKTISHIFGNNSFHASLKNILLVKKGIILKRNLVTFTKMCTYTKRWRRRINRKKENFKNFIFCLKFVQQCSHLHCPFNTHNHNYRFLKCGITHIAAIQWILLYIQSHHLNFEEIMVVFTHNFYFSFFIITIIIIIFRYNHHRVCVCERSTLLFHFIPFTWDCVEFGAENCDCFWHPFKWQL